ncbi:MAG: carboxypeptidase regulatory-like domain-containing protein [Acidobacteria bacterium]|nr:carboxypeptidase regulatory-like domain-containing protein [Acidobacteriota bacterium]
MPSLLLLASLVVTGAPLTQHCEMHVATERGERISPCSERPAKGWIEDGEWMSFPAARWDGPIALVRAVTVRVDAHSSTGGWAEVVRLPDERFERPFRRRVSMNGTVRLPAGRFVAFAFDGRRNVTAVSAPTMETNIALRAPVRGTDVVAFVAWPTGERADPTAELTLDDGGRSKPAVRFADDEGVVAVWNADGGERALLSGRSSELVLRPEEVELRRRSVRTIRTEFRRWPRLTVDVRVPREAAEDFLALKPVVRIKAQDAHHDAAVRLDAPMQFEKLSPELLDVTLQIGALRYRQRADLTTADDATLTFAFEPITISGTVTLGDAPLHARIAFRTGLGGLSTAKSDPSGAYEIRLWNPDRYVLEVQPLEGATGTPYNEMVLLTESQRLDVHVPQASVGVHVVDASTGKAVSGAFVGGMSRWMGEDGQRGHSLQAKTDADGKTRFAFLQPGSVTLRAVADGYRDSDDITSPIAESATPTIEIRLVPQARKTSVTLLLPSGAPAANAEALASVDANGERETWRGRADANGMLELPELPHGSFVFLRHPLAAGTIVRWTNDADPRWTLAPRAAMPLMIRLSHRGGTAFVAMKSAGIWIGGTALQFLYGAPSLIDATGIWTARDVPTTPLAIVAWRDPAATPSVFDALAKRIASPWPSLILLDTAD